MLKIGLDAMGGDFAPEAAVKGAVMASAEIGADSKIVLFGDKERIEAILAGENCPADRFEIVPTTEATTPPRHSSKRRIRASRSDSHTWPRVPSRASHRPAARER